ncbi:unnamed protein product [Chondrus crispus]|uniref:Uncharacterized protein n=1 Tax=Chondrus crispus TaxID=2769 RepID=R7Q5H1_CHOCR|nr:unnamed protein product [Chondrus crispus]CDF32616.1 unnamed protein product [Chondrus crispus]|eukprot:XP_005712387.1 unnamed protein product [Chondrus crispus]
MPRKVAASLAASKRGGVLTSANRVRAASGTVMRSEAAPTASAISTSTGVTLKV